MKNNYCYIMGLCHREFEAEMIRVPNGKSISKTLRYGALIVRLESFSPSLLEELMAQKGWDQNRLALESGLTQAAISKLLSGTDPRNETLKKLGKALGVLFVADWLTEANTLSAELPEEGQAS